jgi:hypothetical protein
LFLFTDTETVYGEDGEKEGRITQEMKLEQMTRHLGEKLT